MSSHILFKNQPKLSGFDIDKKADELRTTLVPHIKEFLETEDLFKDKEVQVEFSHSGVSSLIGFIEVAGEKYVLKIPLFNSSFPGSEARFLKAWEAVSVSVPHVYKEGTIGNRPFILMQFIDAPLLTDAIHAGKVKKEIGFDLGKILAQMHISKVERYGRPQANGIPEYKIFEDWILSEDMQKRYKVVQENNLLGEEHGALQKVLDILIAYTEKDPTSTYCHFDFGANNILASEPLTVIDPDPMFNNGIIDIGRSILLASSGGFMGNDLKEGYFSGDTMCDEQALQASIILSAYYKFPYWHKKDKTKQIENVRKYLIETKKF